MSRLDRMRAAMMGEDVPGGTAEAGGGGRGGRGGVDGGRGGAARGRGGGRAGRGGGGPASAGLAGEGSIAERAAIAAAANQVNKEAQKKARAGVAAAAAAGNKQATGDLEPSGPPPPPAFTAGGGKRRKATTAVTAAAAAAAAAAEGKANATDTATDATNEQHPAAAAKKVPITAHNPAPSPAPDPDDIVITGEPEEPDDPAAAPVVLASDLLAARGIYVHALSAGLNRNPKTPHPKPYIANATP